MKVSDLISHLQTYYSPQDHICAPIWQAGDVQQVAEDMEPSITISNAEVAAVLGSMERNHDACFGITWETIQYAISAIRENQ